MAHTAKGRALTEDHRRAQAAVSTSLVDIITDLFLSVFSPADIDGSSAKFMESALPVVLAARDMSTEVATTYLDAFRRVELQGLVDSSELTPDLADPLSVPLDILQEAASAGLMSQSQVDQRVRYLAESMPSPGSLAASLHSSGAAVAKRRIKAGDSVTKARDTAAKAVAAKAMKLAADGGRAPLLQEVNNGTNGAVGYARVIDADPCPFCSMLASRGVYYAGKEQPGAQLYRSDSFGAANARFVGDGEFKVHDGCQCTLEPVYYRNDGSFHLPGNGDELAREWAQVAAGAPDPAATWRRWRESGTLPPEYEGPLEQVGTKRDRPDGPTGRSITRSPGQAEGTTRPARDVPKVELTRETVERYLSMYEARLEGLNRELAELADRGLTEGDLTYLQLKYERDRLVKRVSTYREYLG